MTDWAPDAQAYENDNGEVKYQPRIVRINAHGQTVSRRLWWTQAGPRLSYRYWALIERDDLDMRVLTGRWRAFLIAKREIRRRRRANWRPLDTEA